MNDTSTTFTRRWTIAGVTAAMVALAGAALAWHGHAQAFGPGSGHRHGGWEQADPESIGKKIDAMVAFRLADVDATPEQKNRIAAIMKGAAGDLASVLGQARDLRRKSMELLAAPTIDRAQIEALRVQQMQIHETVSRRMVQAFTDAADVLTPEQRAKLTEKRQRRADKN